MSKHNFYRKSVIVGAGYIAVEMAQILHSLGSEVTLLIRGDAVLRNFDEMISKAVTEEIQANGVNILSHTQVSRCGPCNKSFWWKSRLHRYLEFELSCQKMQNDAIFKLRFVQQSAFGWTNFLILIKKMLRVKLLVTQQKYRESLNHHFPIILFFWKNMVSKI